MKQVTLSPTETLLRESIIARINIGAQALCEQDVAEKQSSTALSINEDPIGIYTAVVSKLINSSTTTEEVSNFITIGSLVVARQMKSQHQLSKALEELEKLKIDYASLHQLHCDKEPEEVEIEEVESDES
ncbi:hypothetical protein VPAG_00018 [Vibrio phage douglas 12A4]|uniref:hypothetical protein n=1 Tax=Vibrio phage douglas 12A4 TaxID=573171 RepID=UPI0002C0D277|nr:hypothetical protein VPAG_00018 [Vibrio phage douglas 12A4]AGG58054.1 hypothetical protein VPAG_00018 [Vibrio phage douglas 12A4]